MHAHMYIYRVYVHVGMSFLACYTCTTPIILKSRPLSVSALSEQAMGRLPFRLGLVVKGISLLNFHVRAQFCQAISMQATMIRMMDWLVLLFV